MYKFMKKNEYLIQIKAVSNTLSLSAQTLKKIL